MSIKATEEVVVESEGVCNKCHRVAVLGNGLCQLCFDKKVDREQDHGFKYGHRVYKDHKHVS